MSIEIPTNMEEVAMKIAQAQVRGTSLTKDEVIKTAVLDLMQSFMDEALEGHYDDVAWRDQTLVVTDFMAKKWGRWRQRVPTLTPTLSKMPTP